MGKNYLAMLMKLSGYQNRVLKHRKVTLYYNILQYKMHYTTSIKVCQSGVNICFYIFVLAQQMVDYVAQCFRLQNMVG